jgi:Holliday junction resolvase RusA-like endonuclease
MVKAVCDALQFAGIVENDRQIIGGTFIRGICEDEHTVIVLKEARYNAYSQIVPDGSC